MTVTAYEIAQLEEFMRVYEAAPVAHRVAFHRPIILQQCLKWRALMTTAPEGRDGIVPADMLRWQQTRLARLRAWRKSGRAQVLH